jgi:uracil-DNA glycosylase family 4
MLPPGFYEGITNCKRCARLLEWAGTRKGKRKLFQNQDYWGRPVPGFGDPNGSVLIVGLAPGAHGANRTGRPFTGDEAGNHLYSALFRAGFSNKKVSKDRFDGLELENVYITNVVKCAPPGDKPDRIELSACLNFLKKELEFLKSVRVILAMGKKAFDQIKLLLKEKDIETGHLNFIHGAEYSFESKFPLLKVTYHTSKRNYARGIISDDKLDKIFIEIKSRLQENPLGQENLLNRKIP